MLDSAALWAGLVASSAVLQTALQPTIAAAAVNCVLVHGSRRRFLSAAFAAAAADAEAAAAAAEASTAVVVVAAAPGNR